MGGRYSYDEIESNYTIISTVGEFAKGIIVVCHDNHYYEFRRNFTDGKQYTLIKRFKHYVTQYKLQ